MKRPSAGLLGPICIIALLLVGCSSSSTATSSSKTPTSSSSAPLHSEVPSEYLSGFTVALQDGTPPEAYLNSAGQPEGISPNLVRQIASLLGVPIHIYATTFENELLGLEAGRDGFVTDTNITSQRERLYDQMPYYYVTYRFFELKSAPAIASSFSGLCGMSVADEVGDAEIPFIQSQSKSVCVASGKKPITLVEVPSFGASILALNSGRVQAVAGPVDFLTYESRQASGSGLQITGPSFDKVSVGLSFPKGSKLAPVVQKALTMLIQNGTYQKIMTEYGYGPDLQFTRITINPTPLTPAS